MNNECLLITAMADKCKTPLQEADSPFANLPQPLHPKHLCWMCNQIVLHADDWPLTKSHRWLGFVQCGLMANQILDFKEIKAMFEESKNAYGSAVPDRDLADHLDPSNTYEFDIGGQG